MRIAMKLSQKKNCNGCKGGYYEPKSFHQVCELGCKVKTKSKHIFQGVEIGIGIPLEPCYKPMTYSDYLLARD